MQFITAVLLFLVCVPTSEKEEKITWQEGRKLSWSDFKGTPSGPSDYVASTNSGVSFSFSYSEQNGKGIVEFTVLSNFYPNLSWYRPTRVSEYILEHEQMHFDISELYARKLRKALSKIPQNREFKEVAEVVYEQNEWERSQTQEQYDLESDHSNHRENEYRWRDFIAEQLNAYESWK